MHYHRAEREQFVAYLAAKYPRCFFENPSQRLPLKHGVIDDLIREKALDPEKLGQALGWYMDNFGYRYCLLAGADRVDLSGRKVGTVTIEEHRAARAWIAARKKELAERPPYSNSMNGAHHVITKPKSPAALPPRAASCDTVAAEDPSLALLHSITSAAHTVRTILTENQFEALRPALAAAAVKEIIGRAETLLRAVGTEGDQ